MRWRWTTGRRCPAYGLPLVLAQEDDPAHPVLVAVQLPDLPLDARLEVLPPGGLLWRHRAAVRRVIGEFLTPPAAW